MYIHTYFAWRTFVVRGDIKESRLGVLLITDDNCCELGLLTGRRLYTQYAASTVISEYTRTKDSI